MGIKMEVKYQLKNKMTRIAAGMVLFMLLNISAVFLHAQDTGGIIRVAVHDDETVYVYHTLDLPLGYGYNIYRSIENGDFERLNERVVYGATSETEFSNNLGRRLYTELVQRLNMEDSPATLITLRGDRASGLLYTFVYPEIARELNRLYVDNKTPAGATVTYKIIPADLFGTEQSDSLMATVSLRPAAAPEPTGLIAENEGRTVTLYWNYAANAPGEDDKVIRFELLYREPEQEEWLRINRNALLRNEAQENYEYLFEVPYAGAEYQFLIRALDITGRIAAESDVLTTMVESNTPPRFIENIEGTDQDDGMVVITWPVAASPDVAGYHLYRASGISDSAPLTRLTDFPLPVLENFYIDSVHADGARTLAYRVSAVGNNGLESERSNAVVVQVSDRTPPPSVDALQAEYSPNGAVELQWQAPAMPDDFQTYILTRRTLMKGSSAVPVRLNESKISLNENRWTDQPPAGFIEGESYEYVITASDSTDNISEEVSVILTVPNLSPPDTPANFRAENENGESVLLRWNPTAAIDVSHFEIMRKRSDGTEATKLQVPEGTFSFRDEDVEVPQNWVYQIAAVDTAGNRSDLSAADTVNVRYLNPPRDVRNIRAVAQESGVLISWEPVPDTDLDGYLLYKSEIATGIYKPVGEEIIRSESYTDTQGSEGEWYRVEAVNTSGNRSRAAPPAQAVTTEQSGL